MRALTVGVMVLSSLSLASSPRDPFAPPREPPKPPEQCKSTLCQYDLADLKLVAIVARGLDSVAMFESNDGKGLVAKRNVQIGTAGARITQIDRECLTLTRFVSAANGHYEPVTERICIASAKDPSEYDYLVGGLWRAP